MKKFFLLICLIPLFGTPGCKKEEKAKAPVAQFSYIIGTEGFVDFTDESENADTYHWSFGDGASSSLLYPSHIYLENGSYTVTLKVSGEGGEDENSQNLNITNISSTGHAIFYINGSGTFEPITISVSGTNVGTITYFYSTIYPTAVPDCGESCCVTIERPAGTYPFTATSNSHYWSGNITINNGLCQPMKLVIN